MSCKSAIYTALTTPTTVLAGGTMPLGAIIRRYGRDIDLSGNGINICDAGYYDVDISVTVLPTAAGAITATLLNNGVPVPGATATGTAAAAGNAVNLSITALVRQMCNCGVGTLTVVLSAASTVNNLAVRVERI